MINEEVLTKSLRDMEQVVQKYATQTEFDRAMSRINNEEGLILGPVKDAQSNLNIAKSALNVKLAELNVEVSNISREWKVLEAERVKAARQFHDLKHRLVILNPPLERCED